MKFLTTWLRGLRSDLECRATARTNKRAGQRLAFDHLEDRAVPATGWAASMPSTASGAGGWSVALDPANTAVYVAGDQIAKYTTEGTLLWSQSLDSQPSMSARGIAVDPTGSAAYVAGSFTGSFVLGSQTLTSAGDRDAFVAKLDSSGNVLWAKSYGALGLDSAGPIAVDASGVYINGVFTNTVAFDAGHTLTSTGRDAYVLKLDESGNVVYATQTGSTGQTTGGAQIAVDGSGKAYVTGNFTGTVTLGASTLTAVGGASAYIAQVDASGNATWARQVSGKSAGLGLVVDGSGHLFASGNLWGTAKFGDAGDPSGATTLTSFGANDTFIASLDSATGAFLWSKQIGGATAYVTRAQDLALDSAGNVVLAGSFYSASNATVAAIDCDPGTKAAILTNYNSQTTTSLSDGFVAKLSPSGSFLGAWQMGKGYTYGVAVGSDDSIYTTGFFFGSGIPATFDTGSQFVSLTNATGGGFVSRMTPDKGTIFGQAYRDFNRNGVQDGGDTPFAGVTVYIDTNNNGVRNNNEPTATTDAQGGFRFSHLAPGTYTVRVVAPSGYSATTPAAFTINVTAGQANNNAVFGIGRTPKTTTYSNSTAITTSASSPNAISTITIGDSYLIQTLSITLKVTNSSNKPLTINLYAPDGAVVTLVANTKVNGTLTYSVPAFVGKNVIGLWRLEVLGLAGGKLNNWSMSIFG